MADGAASPFSNIHRLLNYSIAAAKNAKGGDCLRFSNDRQFCFYEGHGFEITTWQAMVKDIVRIAESVGTSCSEIQIQWNLSTRTSSSTQNIIASTVIISPPGIQNIVM